MRKEYKTVAGEARVELEERKSLFIASVKPVSSEENALEFINRLKSEYWDASHNVYAYHIAGDSVIQRFSDDGEPSGTAGMPVMEVIKRMEMQDLVVVVTRYFGGTLLGASGLIRAYSKSASQGIEAAGIATMRLCKEIRIMVEYALLGRMQHLVAASGYSIQNVIYGQDVEIIVHVPVDETGKFLDQVEEITNARAVVEKGREEWRMVHA